jgi:putative tryptophan/tyrosine transport system substrate-binding protein
MRGCTHLRVVPAEEPGPIRREPSRGHSVWVTAFAGTTIGEACAGHRTNRRDFITLLGSAAAWPATARAQQSSMPVIGWLNSGSPAETKDGLREFRRGLSESGFVEGQNVAIEYRYAEGHFERLPDLAADLARRRVSLLIASAGNAPVLAAKSVTTTIPILFNIGADPVAAGFVASLNRPIGNLTGYTSMNAELVPKRLELLHELLPTTSSIALLLNPANPNAQATTGEALSAARQFGLAVQVLHASTEQEIDGVFAALSRQRIGALMINPDAFLTDRSEELGRLALRYAIPAIFQYRAFAAAGGLMTYGGSVTDGYRQIGGYAGRILKGEKPADLPVEQSTKVELIINLKAAKALGITVPLSLIYRADEVIE